MNTLTNVPFGPLEVESVSVAKVLIICFIMVLGAGCDSDTVTIYKIKSPPKTPTAEVKTPPPDLNPTDAKPVLNKECIPRCTGNTQCVGGRCTGTVNIPLKEFGDVHFIGMDKTGIWDPKTQSEEAHYFNGF